MKRWLIHATIAAYLASLAFGIFAYAVKFHQGSHPVMYFIVWDMFCGWSAYSQRVQIIGEGESGKYYELAPGPWGEYHPYASIGRRHYDSFGNHFNRLARNVLQHTDHEPMARIFVVEENWAKKYNLPDHIWNRRFDEPKDPHIYYHVRAIWDGNCRTVANYANWLGIQTSMCVNDNPRLIDDSRKGRPFFTLNPANRSDQFLNRGQTFGLPDRAAANSPLGN